MLFKNPKHRNVFLSGLGLVVLVAFVVGGNLINLQGRVGITEDANVEEGSASDQSSASGGGGGSPVGTTSNSGGSSTSSSSGNVGKITVKAASSPVQDDVVVAGDYVSNALLVARYSVAAEKEAFKVTKMTFQNDSMGDNSLETNKAIKMLTLKYPTSLAAPTTLDGSKTAALKEGKATFEDLGLMVSADSNVQVELSANLFSISQGNSGTQTNGNAKQQPDLQEVLNGNQIEIVGGKQLELDFDEGAGFEAVGQTSGTKVTHESASAQFGTSNDVDANEIALYKSMLSFAKDTSSSACSGKLVPGTESAVYCFAVSAHSAGDVSLYKLNFEMVQTALDDKALGTANGIKVYRADGTAVASGTWKRNVASVTFTSEEVVTKGSTNYYVVKAPITFKDGPLNSTLTSRLSAETATAHSASTVAASVSGKNVWSDRSAKSHSVTSSDWTNSYKVKGLPTEGLTLGE